MTNRTVSIVSKAVALILVTAASAQAQDAIDQTRKSAIVTAINRAAPAVVSVNVVQIQRVGSGDPFWDFFMNRRSEFRVEERAQELRSVGSGFFFDSQGHILTNFHVIEDADALKSVTLADGRELPVKFVGADKRTDIAVLIASSANLPYVPLGTSADLMTGEWMIAIGNPFGPLMRDPQPTVTVGVVSANHRQLSPSVAEGERLYQDMIQTDAAINPGNSGGPLINAKGEAVGINTMIFSKGGGNNGLGFAIPIDRAKRVAEEIIKYGRRRDPWAGFDVQDIEALRQDRRGQSFLNEYGIRAESGCLVVKILKAAPAYEAGLQVGDVITAINDAPVHHASDIHFVIWSLFIGDPITLQVDRQGTTKTIQFRLMELTKNQV
ncbi:MAG: trypsin-like peptidase domain-containing protein [Candidatus Hydrogenedentes bacterium]|nr:trypsin-like peptidase domain-containing protein [Candidatus Hydrogenedentota bacterium]